MYKSDRYLVSSIYLYFELSNEDTYENISSKLKRSDESLKNI